MKTRSLLWLPVIALALGAAGYGLYTVGVHQGQQMQSTAPVATGSSVPTTAKKILYWHDPMVPDQHFDHPGKSPFMDMELVPVYADEGDNANEKGGVVSISSEVQQNFGLRTAEATRGTLKSEMKVVGNVAYDERAVAVVQARAQGFVEHLAVRAPLDPVKQGQTVAELYVPDWVAVQEDYLAVKRMPGADTTALLEGAKQRLRLAGMSDEQIRHLDSSGGVQARIAITAPVSGVVSELDVREGMTVMPGATLFKLNGLDTVWVNAEVPEAQAAAVRPGTTVEATATAWPGKTFHGRVSALLPDVDATTRTIKARVVLDNPGHALLPGMFVSVNLASAARHETVLVPSEAIIATGTRTLVFVVRDDGRFAPVEVQTGQEGDGQTEILKGLSAGQKVVVSGQFLVDSEASLQSVTARMAAPASTSSIASTPKVGPVHHGVGVVEAIDPDSITISHQPIASLQWPAMTMGFMPPAGGVPSSIKVGSHVNFDITPTPDGQFRIVQMSTAGAKP